MSSSRKLAKWTAIVFSTSLLSVGLAYILRLILARELSVEEYGLFYAVLSFVYLFGILKDLGLGPAVAKHVSEYAALKKIGQAKYLVAHVAYVQIVIGFVVFAVLFAGSGYFAASFFKSDVALGIIVILALEFIVGLSTLKPSLQGLQKVVAYSVTEPLRLAIIIALVLTVLPSSAFGIALGYLIAGVLTTAWLVSNLARSFRGIKMEKEKGLVRHVFKFASIIFVSSVVGYVVSYTDVLALTYFRSLYEVGLYQAALPTSQVLWIFATAMGTVLLPFISELWTKGRKQEVSKGLSILIRLAFAGIIPFALVFIGYPDLIIRTLFGEAYLPGAPALQVLAVGSLFYTIFAILGTALMGMDKPKTFTKITATVAVINLALNIALVPSVGIIGAAYATSLSYLIGFALTSASLRKSIKLSIPGWRLAKLLMSIIPTGLVIIGVKEILVMEPIPEAIITMGIGLVVYAVYIFLSKSVTKSDLELLKGMGIPIPAAVIGAAGRIS